MNLSPTRVSRTQHWLLAGACVSAALLIGPVQRRIDLRLGNRGPDPDLLYFGSAAMVQKMALGYQSLVADIYWMRAIQYYGRREEAARRLVRYKNLASLLDITTTLDPDLIDAYRAGSGFLAEPEPAGAGQPLEAVRLLDKGIRSHPDDWRLYFDKGFVYFWFLKDFAGAGQVWLTASRLRTTPPWMGSLAAMAMSKSGAVETARALWQRQFQESDRPDVRENAWNHLASIQVNEDFWALEYFLERFRAKHNRLPANLEELVRAGYLQKVPLDPSNTPYLYDPATGIVRLGPASKVRYLSVPFDYRQAFREKLGRLCGVP
jgi:hypothetical protein